MAFTNPNGGSGYLFGAKLPSAHVNLVWAYIEKAVDGIGGGTYTLAAPLTFAGAGVNFVGGSHGIQSTGIIEVFSGGKIIFDAGSALELNGNLPVKSGGTITVKSEVGRGTEFTMRFPAQNAPSAQAAS